MNTNFLHNLGNLLTVVMAGLVAMLLATGCTQEGEMIVCTASWLDPKLTAFAVAGIGALKIAINVWRDGFFGLFKNQPPVQ